MHEHEKHNRVGFWGRRDSFILVMAKQALCSGYQAFPPKAKAITPETIATC
jgi:hypothetical protein